MKKIQTILTITSLVSSFEYGGKAQWMSWLYQHGYNVPYAIFLPGVEATNTNVVSKDESELSYIRELLKPVAKGDKYDIAIRSSATCEDDYARSLAGHFKTFIGVMTFEEVLVNIKQVIESSRNVNTQIPFQMGVILQKRIEASFSGVAFSSNPLNGSKFQCIISVIRGMGSALVSGKTEGEDIVLTKEGEYPKIPPYTTNISKDNIKEMWFIAKEIENNLNYPVDIEWCIEKNTGKLYILQCRPATGILYHGYPVIFISLENEKEWPNYVSKNEKITLRLTGEKVGVRVSKAFIVVVNCIKKPPEIPDLSRIHPSRYCRGYSVVLVYPENISGKVESTFFGKNMQFVKSFFEGCQRYAIRSYPKYNTLKDCISGIAEMCFEQYWQSIIIVQEIFDPKYAGIIKKMSDGFIIELAQGHFIPKGIVPTSQYIISFSGELLYSNEVYQDKRFRILEGVILEEKIPSHDSLVSVPIEILVRVVQDFKPFLINEQTAVEFGLLENVEDNMLCPYLIDFVQDKSIIGLDVQSISDGIVSKGIVTGKLVILEQNDITGDTFDFQFHNKVHYKIHGDETHIFLCKRPDISLLKVIQNYNPQKLGFIFKEGSILSHLAIILREQGIPAIVIEDTKGMLSGKILTIDAITSGLKGKERLKHYDL